MKKKIILVLLILLSISFGSYFAFKDRYVLDNNKKIQDYDKPFDFPNLGDAAILFNSNVVNFSNNALKSRNVQNAIDELYTAIQNGCKTGYNKGNQTGGTYTCTKASTNSAGTTSFESSNVKYDNTSSGLSSTNVSSAIVELAELVPSCLNGYVKQTEVNNSYDCKKTITITANNQTITYGSSISQNTNQVTVEGLETGHSLNSITLTGSTVNVPGGTITPSNAVIYDSGSNNITSTYTINYETGTLTINRKATTMSISPTSGTVAPGASTTTTITTDGDGTKSCETSSSSIATCSVSGNTVTINGVAQGTATITVKQAQGTNYNAATDVTYTATIEPAGITITYNANGGSVSTPSKLIAMDATTYGELIEATPASNDYVFAGWYDAASGGNPITSTTAFTNGTSPTILYAHYESSSGIKCRRVFDAHYLHTETCQQPSMFCAGDGYTGANTTIIYGNAKANGTSLVTGDAFDCKVTTNGGYTERFYYVSDRWTPGTSTSNSAFDSQTAVLIYYKNFKDGAPSDLGVAYDSSNKNYNGPVTAVASLPTTSYWSNISLNSTSRMIYACDNGNCSNTPTLYTNSGKRQISPNPYSYSGKAARLLTVPEVKKGCTSINNKTTVASQRDLKECNFLFERTQYANTDTETYPTAGFWLETPHASNYNNSANANAYLSSVNHNYTNFTNYGVRPAIEVKKSNILY